MTKTLMWNRRAIFTWRFFLLWYCIAVTYRREKPCLMRYMWLWLSTVYPTPWKMRRVSKFGSSGKKGLRMYVDSFGQIKGSHVYDLWNGSTEVKESRREGMLENQQTMDSPLFPGVPSFFEENERFAGTLACRSLLWTYIWISAKSNLWNVEAFQIRLGSFGGFALSRRKEDRSARRAIFFVHFKESMLQACNSLPLSIEKDPSVIEWQADFWRGEKSLQLNIFLKLLVRTAWWSGMIIRALLWRFHSIGRF